MRTTVGIALTVLALVLGTPGPGSQSSAATRAVRKPTILVHVLADRGRVPTSVLGVNHQFDANGRGVWNARDDQPVQAAVDGAIKAGIQSLRFPGGTVANLYDWKRAIGNDRRRCQVVGANRPGTEARGVRRRLAFGPDEFMQFVDAAHTKPNIMVPFATETPTDAADWVEYMNAPVGSNPNGGKDWALDRAQNGHPEPYGVHWWEIGNEPHHVNSRYWMSHDDNTALRQYAFGGSSLIRGENLGKNCTHPTAGRVSNGQANQTFEALYPPVDPQRFQLENHGAVWTRVPDFSGEGPESQVYTLDPESGRVTFGDGQQGKIPPPKTKVTATYRSVHQGYFAFAREMKKVDPSIQVCSTWGAQSFNQLLRRRQYDCMAAHAITLLTNPGAPTWSGALEGHDRFMLKSDALQTRVRQLRRSMPPGTPLVLTEFLAMHGDSKAYPAWGTSVSHAVFMSTLWGAWLNMRIGLGNGDDFVGAGHRAVLGGRFNPTTDSLTREALKPMFSAGGQLLTAEVERNPVRRPKSTPGSSYKGLSVSATRENGAVSILVVNRFPRQSVTSNIRLDRGRATGRATIRSVTGKSFQSWLQPGEPQPSVALHTSTRRIGPTGFTYEFPAASTTVFRIPWARR